MDVAVMNCRCIFKKLWSVCEIKTSSVKLRCFEFACIQIVQSVAHDRLSCVAFFPSYYRRTFFSEDRLFPSTLVRRVVISIVLDRAAIQDTLNGLSIDQHRVVAYSIVIPIIGLEYFLIVGPVAKYFPSNNHVGCLYNLCVQTFSAF